MGNDMTKEKQERQNPTTSKAQYATAAPRSPSVASQFSSYPSSTMTAARCTPGATPTSMTPGSQAPTRYAPALASAPPTPSAPPVPSAPPLSQTPHVHLQERRPPQPYNFSQNELESSTRRERLYPDLGGETAPRQHSTTTHRPVRSQQPETLQRPTIPRHPRSPRSPAPRDEFVVINRDGTTNGNSVAPSVERSSKQGEPSMSCACCGQRLRAAPMYQCSGGHSSCAGCRAAARTCGVCGRPVTDMRSFALEVFIAQMKTRCPNATHGCKRMLTVDEEEAHVRECPFAGVRCPAPAGFSCPWIGKINMLSHHFEQCHPELCAAVNTERTLPGSALYCDQTLVFLFTVGVCHFVLRIEVAGGTLQMAVQLLGTNFNAEKWTYELHVYNKAEPRRKYYYNGLCSAITAPFVPGAELPSVYAASFLHRDELFYKVYLKKRDTDDDREPSLDVAREPSTERTREPSVSGARHPRLRQRFYKNKSFEK